ncbi:phosphoenolpyruvate hydrolase family protein [Caldibacillus thermoamylovorans]|uniref:phosphoenolpyruvate hydrolase family protein n=1 Tax=Caldibacillus thermoamylovorans TaxID=35841 RepID=UPI0020417648|nr:phosphoenolpyruvate hydrolase family protein [Caldibacillus thermoamylovorans]MCM3479205.1 phosphoenolpyruvate hydrolase family protein [Caldibacillus thermoamylovorans]
MPHFEKDQIIKQLKKQIKINRHIIGVAAGSGLTAKYAEEGGADLILALSSGLFRQKGLSSLAAYLSFVNSNDTVMEFGLKELLPRINKIPVIFGLMATDPSIHLEKFIQQVKEKGFAGINNYPTVGLIDGKYREALEEQGISYKQEVESISIANKFGLLTVAFVFNKEQAIQMVDAGADVVCVHLGLTTGGKLGSKHIQSLQSAKILAQEIFDVVTERNPDIIKMVYGGPVNKPVDVQFIYDGTNIDGYIGGSVFERIPAEQVVLQVTESFKKTNEVRYDELIEKIISGFTTTDDYIDFIKRYISLHYKDEISLNEISEILHVSRSHLSTLFKKNVGVSFTDYLIDFRLNRALEIYQEKKLPLTIVAELVGYQNYSQFSKIFKKRKGKSPREFINSNKTTS